MSWFTLRLSNHKGSAVEVGPFNGRALADAMATDFQAQGLVASVGQLARPEEAATYAAVLLRQEGKPAEAEA